MFSSPDDYRGTSPPHWRTALRVLKALFVLIVNSPGTTPLEHGSNTGEEGPTPLHHVSNTGAESWRHLRATPLHNVSNTDELRFASAGAHRAYCEFTWAKPPSTCEQHRHATLPQKREAVPRRARIQRSKTCVSPNARLVSHHKETMKKHATRRPRLNAYRSYLTPSISKKVLESQVSTQNHQLIVLTSNGEY